MKKLIVAVSVSSFAQADSYPRLILEQAGVKVKENPFGRKMTEGEIIEHLRDVSGLLAGLEPLNERVLNASTDLRAIARVGIGMDNVDRAAAERLGIKVSNTPEAPTHAVAELCLTALLAIIRNLIGFNSDLHRGRWQKRMGFGLQSRKVFILGFGCIGRRFAEMLSFFGTEVLVHDIKPISPNNGNYKIVSLAEGLAQADVISLHCSGRERILGNREFALMRPGSVLLNSARGELVDELALIEALDAGIVTAAWLDAFVQEPYDGPLCGYENVLLSPHVGSYTKQCRMDMEERAVRNLLRDLSLC